MPRTKNKQTYKKVLYLHVNTLVSECTSKITFYNVVQDGLELSLVRVASNLLSAGQRYCALSVSQRARRIGNWESKTEEPTYFKRSYGQVYARLGKEDKPKLFRTCERTCITSIGKNGHVYSTSFTDKGRRVTNTTYCSLRANIKRFGLVGALPAVKGDKVLALLLCKILKSDDRSRYELPSALRAAKTLKAKRGVIIQYAL